MMLDDYLLKQPIAYKMISNQLDSDLISHAYIIETASLSDGLTFAKAFAKALLCPIKHKNFENCHDCSQCSAIDDDNFIELKIIEPEGNWITKNQIDDLQNTFMKKAIIGNRKVYIINHFDRMKTNLMDSMLKFIEEPMDGVVAILITNNLSNIIDTIISRCQIISLRKEKHIIEDGNIENVIKEILSDKKYDSITVNRELIDIIIKFIFYYENNHMKILLYTKQMWHDNLKDNNSVDFAFNVILLFYKDVLNYSVNGKLEIFNDYLTEIKYISSKNSIEQLTNKISKIMELIRRLKYNANLNLIVDKLIIDLEKS